MPLERRQLNLGISRPILFDAPALPTYSGWQVAPSFNCRLRHNDNKGPGGSLP